MEHWWEILIGGAAAVGSFGTWALAWVASRELKRWRRRQRDERRADAAVEALGASWALLEEMQGLMSLAASERDAAEGDGSETRRPPPERLQRLLDVFQHHGAARAAVVAYLGPEAADVFGEVSRIGNRIVQHYAKGNRSAEEARDLERELEKIQLRVVQTLRPVALLDSTDD